MECTRFVSREVGRAAAAAVLTLMACFGPNQLAAAKTSTGHSGTVTARVQFRRVPGTFFMNSDRYVLARSSTASGTGSRQVLIDDRTGQHRQLAFPDGCTPDAIGVGAVALVCESGLTQSQQIYDIATGQTQTFTPSPALAQPPLDAGCGSAVSAGAAYVNVVAIGTRWVALDMGSMDPRSFDQFAVQNRQTGQAQCDPPRAHVTIDLNSTKVTRKVCPPLTVPILSRPPGGQAAGSLTALGDGFELAAGANSYLERCGTRLHEFLTSNRYQASSPVGVQCPAVACSLPADRHVIVWPDRGTVHGMWLPSRQRFTIPVPASVDPSHGTDVTYEVGLTGRHLYLSTITHLWQAPLPTPNARAKRARSRSRRHSHGTRWAITFASDRIRR